MKRSRGESVKRDQENEGRFTVLSFNLIFLFVLEFIPSIVMPCGPLPLFCACYIQTYVNTQRQNDCACSTDL